MSSPLELRETLKLERSVWEAVVAGDGEALAQLFSDDYLEVTLCGKRVGRDTIVTESPQVDKISKYEILLPRQLPLGTDAVLLSYHLRLIGTCRAVAIVPVDRWTTSVWRRFDRRWKCCFFQQSPLDQQSPDEGTMS